MLAFAVICALPAQHAGALEKRELDCRAALESGARRWFSHTLRSRQRCFDDIVRGKTAPSTDCTSAAAPADLARRLEKASARLAATLASDCAEVEWALLGFPGPCPATTEGFDAATMQSCLEGLGGDFVEALLASEYPPELEFTRGRAGSCMRGVGRRALAMLGHDVRARFGCQLGKERGTILEAVDCRAGMVPDGPGSGDGAIDREILRSYLAWLRGVPKACARADLDALGYGDACTDSSGGRFDVLDLRRCVFDANRAGAARLMSIVFPTDPVCGNGLPEDGEECDQGPSNSDTTSDACREDCRLPSCGDATTDVGRGEQCDDGNTVSADGCSASCVAEFCGDGIVNGSPLEQCDNGAENSDTKPNACRADCKHPSCGDNVVDPANAEQCDDGNLVDQDGCSGAASPLGVCKNEFCGDGVAQAGLGEGCDDGPANSDTQPDACRTDCSAPRCGDGVTDAEAGEECDDANDDDGDGCTSTCTICGNGVPSGDEECDLGNANSDVEPDGCRTDCRLAYCGDGVTDTGEDCDDADAATDDACLPGCVAATCGDGFVCTADDCTTGPEGGAEICDKGEDNGPNEPCHDDCSGLPLECKVRFRVTTSGLIGALQYTVDYGTETGTFLGSASTVACRTLIVGSAPATFFEDEAKRQLRESVISSSGFATPQDLAECDFATADPGLEAADFTINVLVSTTPDFEEAGAMVAISSVVCQ